MQKTITIEGKDIRFDNNIGWVMEYRDQFNKDILPTMMPLVAGLMDVFVGLVSSTGKTGNLEVSDLVEIAKSDEMFDALVKMSSFEFSDLLDISWAMAKTADESIPAPKRWVRELGIFPVDEIGPALFEMILKSVVSSKNSERLQKAMNNLKPEETK